MAGIRNLLLLLLVIVVQVEAGRWVATSFTARTYYFPSRTPPCSGKWTPWYSARNSKPEYETLDAHRLALNKFGVETVCLYPTNIQRRWSGTESESPKIFDPVRGLYCKNAMTCPNYSVRFCCVSQVCKCPSNYEWRGPFNRDKPLDYFDYEGHFEVRKLPNSCDNPAAIDAKWYRGVDLTRLPFWQAGKRVMISPAHGLICRNDQQKNGKCANFETHLCCPRKFGFKRTSG